MTHILSASAPQFLRLAAVLQRIPVSRSSWMKGIKEGRYPAPVKLGARTVAWRAADIERLLQQLAGEECAA